MTTTTSTAAAMTTEELFRSHGPFVERFLARLGVPADHAEDALQDVFLAVHRNGGYRPGVAKPTSYLANIALHAAHRHRRQERVDRSRRAETSAEQLPSACADPTRALQVQQDLARLRLALARLPRELRTILVLVELEDQSCLAVAETLGLPVGTVYSRLHMARRKLQTALHTVDAVRCRHRAVPPAEPARIDWTSWAAHHMPQKGKWLGFFGHGLAVAAAMTAAGLASGWFRSSLRSQPTAAARRARKPSTARASRAKDSPEAASR